MTQKKVREIQPEELIDESLAHKPKGDWTKKRFGRMWLMAAGLTLYYYSLIAYVEIKNPWRAFSEEADSMVMDLVTKFLGTFVAFPLMCLIPSMLLGLIPFRGNVYENRVVNATLILYIVASASLAIFWTCLFFFDYDILYEIFDV